jgi:hypothetical protein
VDWLPGLVLAQGAELIPKQGDNPWIWATGVLVVLAAFLGREVLKDRDEWRSHARESTAALSANTETLSKATTLVDSMHKGNEALAHEVREGFDKVERHLFGQDRTTERDQGRTR